MKILPVSLINLVGTAVVFILFYSFGTLHQALNALFAGLLVGANLAVIIWAFQKIFNKKSVALAIAVIVFKYSVLILLFFALYKIEWQIDLGFLTGLMVLYPSIAYMVYGYLRKNEIKT
ncbi:MAG: hypothetical protein ABL927_02630 [Bdellovibrionales bacterium]